MLGPSDNIPEGGGDAASSNTAALAISNGSTNAKRPTTQPQASSYSSTSLPRLGSSVSAAKPKSTAHVAVTNKRQDDFNQLFGFEDEELIEDFSCAYQSDTMLYHGRMYVSHNYVCFHSQIFKKTVKILAFKDIQDIQKRNTAIVFPNAIEFTAKNKKFLFPSFLYRDQAFKLVTELWEESKRERTFALVAKEEARRKQDGNLREPSIDPSTEESDGLNEEGHERDNGMTGDENSPPSAQQHFPPTPVQAGLHRSEVSKPTSPAASPASPVSTQPLPLSSQSGAVLRSFSVNISQNVNGDSRWAGWVHSAVSWPINKLLTDDGSGEVPQPTIDKKEIELKNFGGIEEQTSIGSDEMINVRSAEAQNDSQSKEQDVSSVSTSGSTLISSESTAADEGEDQFGDVEREVSNHNQQQPLPIESEEMTKGKSDANDSKDGARDGATEGGNLSEPSRQQTVVPMVDTCSHILGTSALSQVMLNIVLPIAQSDIFGTFFDDKNPEALTFWNELHENEPLCYSEFQMSQWALRPENCCLYRTLTFRVPLKHPLGPKSTRVIQEQRLHYVNKDTLVMETTSSSLDVPYGDIFTTGTRWLMGATIDSNGKPATRLTVHAEVKFTKSVWLKSVIQNSAIDGISTFFPAWTSKVQRVLALKAQVASLAKRSTPRRASLRRSSSKRTTSAEETSSKLRKPKTRRTKGSPEGLTPLGFSPPPLMQQEGILLAPTQVEPSSVSNSASPHTKSSFETLVRSILPNLPLPSLATVATWLVLLLLVFFFVLPSLFSLSSRITSLENELRMVHRTNVQLRERVLFMQLVLSAFEDQARSEEDTGDSSISAPPPPRDALAHMWRY